MTPSYLREVIARGTAASSKRFSLVTATVTFSIATIILSIAVCFGVEGAYLGLLAVSAPLAGLAGVAYKKKEDIEGEIPSK